ncbi:uncharacterized protein LOC135155796 [Lytechinus pictus]|uniref:uncharacterized protein LOC135155796 n=1 Tax=Lytechinus pictus TaxID=7653 RepID=UPI0030B9E321
MRGFEPNKFYLFKLLESVDIVAVQEHWLQSFSEHKLTELKDTHIVYAKSFDNGLSSPSLTRRGKGRVALFLHRRFQAACAIVDTTSNRLLCAHICDKDCSGSLLFVNVYMPSGSSAADQAEYADILTEISSLIGQYPSAKVILMGDFNADITGLPSSWNRKAQLLQHYLTENSLVSMMTIYQNSSDYTYMSDDGSKKSYIDHIITHSANVGSFFEYMVVPEDPLNTSDHLPIQASFMSHLHPCKEARQEINMTNHKYNHIRIKWNQASSQEIQEVYSTAIDDICDQLLSSLPDEASLTGKHAEYMLNTLSQAMLNVSMRNLPYASGKKRKRQKPEWSTSVDSTYKAMKLSWKKWKLGGKNRSQANPLWIRYRSDKAAFRKQLRKQRHNLESSRLLQIERAKKGDDRLFYKLIKERRSRADASPVDTLIVNGKSYTGKATIQGFEEYFKMLSMPNPGNNYQSTITDTVEKLANVISTCTPNQRPFTRTDLDKAIGQLKKNKAAGADQISAEHVLFGGEKARNLLLVIMNTFVAHSFIPDAFKYGIILPLHKGNGKPLTDPSCYRGITLSSTFCKVLELLIKPKLLEQLHLLLLLLLILPPLFSEISTKMQ